MSGADPFEEFEFKPLTDGLGFHKKAEKIKTDIRSSGLAQEKTARTIPESPRSLMNSSASNEIARPATKSISDLIAQLPPSLDFLEEKPAAAAPLAQSLTQPLGTSLGASSLGGSAGMSKKLEFEEALSARPQIFQPLARDEYKAPTSTISASTSSSTISPMSTASGSATAGAMSGATGGLSFPTPGTKASTNFGDAAAKPQAASPYRERIDESLARAFPHMEKASKKSKSTDVAKDSEAGLQGLEAVPAAPVAAFLDAMVAAGISTIALVSILAITHINLMGLLNNAQTDLPTQIHLVALFIAVLQMYMLVARAFFGASLGEWAFDLQLGSARDQKRVMYPLLVAWRSILVTATGLIILPVASLIARRDLIKYLTGLQLYRRPN
jgi:hypothetical protein